MYVYNADLSIHFICFRGELLSFDVQLACSVDIITLFGYFWHIDKFCEHINNSTTSKEASASSLLNVS